MKTGVLFVGLGLAALCTASSARAQSKAGVEEPLPPPPTPPSDAAPPLKAAPPPAAPAESAASSASPAVPPPPPRLALDPMLSDMPPVFVRLDAGNGAYAVIPAGRYRRTQLPPIAACEGPCGFWAWPGSYRVHLEAGAAVGERNITLRVRDPGGYTLVPGDSAARSDGLALGIAGAAIVAVGVVLVTAAVLADCSGPANGQCGDTTSIAYWGLGSVAVGGGISAAGWIIFAKNSAHFAYLPPAAAATPPPFAARVGLVPLPRGGFGLGAAAAF